MCVVDFCVYKGWISAHKWEMESFFQLWLKGGARFCIPSFLCNVKTAIFQRFMVYVPKPLAYALRTTR